MPNLFVLYLKVIRWPFDRALDFWLGSEEELEYKGTTTPYE